jgi:Tfp pilus assembly protein PilX
MAFLRLRARSEGGQALVVVAGLLATLVMLPVSVQLLATGQAPLANAAAYQQEALEAARAGLADYVNHTETYDNANYASNSTSYSKYCSSGAFSTCTTGFSPGKTVDSTNPAFVTNFGVNSWVTVETGNTAGNAAYQYVVDSSGVANSSCPTPYSVYAVGKAGAGSHYVYQELKAVLQDVPGNPVICPSPNPQGGTCTTNNFSVTVPPGAGYAKLVLSGAAGGASSGGTTGGGGNGATETAYVQVTPGQTLTFTAGGAGAQGDFSLLNIFGNGGQPGCSGMPGLAGGTGGGAGLTLLSGEGGGGGAGSAVCWGTATASTCNSPTTPSVCTTSPPSSSTTCVMAIAGGGGGQGGAGGGQGGYWNNGGTWTATGHQGSGLLFHASGGPAGGTSGSSSSTVGANGASTGLGVGTGTGGGGGGGDCGTSCASGTQGGGGGGGAGQLLLANGGGGGLGASVAMAAAPGCTDVGPSAITSYPVSGGTGSNGAVAYTFYSASSSCNGTAQPGAWSLFVQQVPPNAVYSSVLA